MKEVNLKEYIEQLIANRRIEYLNSPDRIIEDYENEQARIDEYNGRQLLELLQNADDAAASAEEKVCHISLKTNEDGYGTLIVANNGEQFSKGGFRSLMFSHFSPKKAAQNKIGQKGLGFRSVLSWAKEVTIKSYDLEETQRKNFAATFSKTIAAGFLKELISEKPGIDAVIKAEYPEDQNDTIAVLRCPKVLEENEIPEYSEYDTYIVIELKENQIDNVIKQIEEELDMEVLLFLNNLETISVEYPNGSFTLKKETNGDNNTIIRTNKEGQIQKTWHVKTRSEKIKGNEDGKSKEKNYEIKIAWTDELDDQKNILYSYFRTNVRFPFPALVHATFDLTSDRNHLLPQNDFNEGIKASLKDFLIEVAATIASSEDTSYKALKLLCVEDNDILAQSDLVERIKETNQMIFPTVANEYISYIDNPVFLRYDYASFIIDTEKSKFKSLLQFSDDPSVVKLLECLGVIKTPDNEILSSMSEMTLEKEGRAQLIFWLAKEKYGENVPENLVQMLIDSNGKPALPDNVVFLPPAAGPSLVIPNDLQLKIMDAELYEKLKSLFKESNAEVVASKLGVFGVKVYRFADIFRLLVPKSTSQFDKNLIVKLYDLYINNKDSGAEIAIPSSQQYIYVLNRNGDIVKTTEIYFGKDYGNTLCEQLYQYDQSKFIAPPDLLGLNGMDSVIEFLSWLGVADKPRYQLVELKDEKEKKEYGNYALKNFPYDTKRIYWNDPSINTYEKLLKCGYNVIKVMVTSIDDLDKILQNSNIELVLTWFLEDKRFDNPKELLEDSFLEYYVYGKWYNSKVKRPDMPSYLLWKLPQITWIKTCSNTVVPPCKCCISKSITEEFSPLIEVPKIDFKLLNSYSRQDVEYILHRIGIKTEIKDFTQQDIYSILNKLPEIDPDGKKARLLYRELIEKLDEDDIDENSPERNNFVETGKVFCKNGNGVSYKSVNGVYYLQDKIYGENIVSQFDTIAIDRRRNSTLIKRLFGVEPLANLKFSLKGEPKVNESLNADLQKELHNLTPYVYALRSSGSKDANFSKLGDEWSVQVCSEILPVYKKKDGDEESGFILNDYEFVYVSEKNTYFVLIKDSVSTTLSELKADFKFVDIVSEIYSNILKVDSIRPIVSRLFEADTTKKDHILQTEIDDSAAKLKEARRQLNIVNDQKVLFWLGVLETLEEEVEYKEYEKSELDCLVKERIGIQIDDYGIDYNELISENCSVSEIKKLFAVLKIDVAAFNQHSSCDMNLVPYYKKRLVTKKNDKERLFEQLFYEQLKDKKVDDKKAFLSTLKAYRAFHDFKVDNSIDVDLDMLLNNAILGKFKVDLAKSTNQPDINSVYDKNYDELMKDDELNWEEFKAFLDDSDEARSLVYFAEYDTIKTNFKAYQNAIKTESETHFNGNAIKGKGLTEIYQGLREQMELDDLVIEDVKTEGMPSGKKGQGRQGGPRTPGKRMTEDRKKKIGFIGEALVYHKLKEQFGDVSWDSGYAKEANVNPKGDDMYHYDIKYKKGDEYCFVEVKSTTTDNLEFEISELELEFAKENKKNYEIFIVTNVENEKPRIKNIGNPFVFEEGESFMNCHRFTVLNDSFTIKMKEKK